MLVEWRANLGRVPVSPVGTRHSGQMARQAAAWAQPQAHAKECGFQAESPLHGVTIWKTTLKMTCATWEKFSFGARTMDQPPKHGEQPKLVGSVLISFGFRKGGGHEKARHWH